MADIQTIDVQVQADVSRFLSAMNQVEQVAKKAIGAMDSAGSSASSAGDKAGSSASGVGMATAAWNVAVEAVEKAVEGLEKFGEAAIDAANRMDPAGAEAWHQSVEKLNQSFMVFAGQVGKQLRPVLEDIMASMTKAFKYLASIDWGEIFKGMDVLLSNIWNGIKSFGEKIYDWAATIADAIATPFKSIEIFISKLIHSALDEIAKLADFAKDKMNIGQGGQMFRDMGAGLEDFVTNFKVDLGEGFKDLGKILWDSVKSNSGGHLEKALANAGVANAPQQNVVDQDQLASKKAIAELQAQMDAAHRQAQEITDKQQYQSAENYWRFQKAGAAEAAGIAQQGFEEAQKKLDLAVASGSMSAIEKAKADVDAAHTAVLQSYDKINQINAGESKAAQNFIDGMTAAVEKQKKVVEAQEQATKNALAAADKVRGTGAYEQQELAYEIAKKQLQIEEETLNKELTMRDMAQQRGAAMQLATAQQDVELRLKGAKMAADIQMKAAEASVEYQKAMSDQILGMFAQGEAGSVIGGAKAGMDAGEKLAASGVGGATFGANAGPIGAAVGAAAAMIAQSEAFKSIMDDINKIIGVIGEALAAFVKPWQPIIDVLVDVLTPIIKALTPIFMAVELALNPFLIAFMLVGAALEPLAPVLNDFANAVTELWNDIMHTISSMLSTFKDIPVIGDAANSLASMFGKLTIHTDQAAQAVDDFTKSLQDQKTNEIAQSREDNARVAALQQALAATNSNSDPAYVASLKKALDDALKQQTDDLLKHAISDAQTALAKDAVGSQAYALDYATLQSLLEQQAQEQAQDAASNGSSSAADKIAADVAKMTGINNLLQSLKQSGATDAKTKSEIDTLTKALADAQSQYQQDMDQAAVDYWQQQLDTLKAAGMFGTDQWTAANAALQKAMAQQAADAAANTTATNSNTDATNKVIEALTNIPQAYRVAQTLDRVTAGMSGGIYTGPVGGSAGPGKPILPSIGGGIVINGNVTIQASSADLVDQITTKLKRNAYLTSGNAARIGGPRYATFSQG